MLQGWQASAHTPAVSLSERVRKAGAALGCDVWARSSGRHVLLGLTGDDAFARVTPLGAGSFGLAFREGAETWEPMLLVDALGDVVEHALVGVGAL